MPDKRFTWTPGNVSSTRIPAMSIRTYLEQRQLRRILAGIEPIESAAEVGAGFGRMLVALAEHARTVTGFEREPALVKAGNQVIEREPLVRVERLDRLPARDRAFDLVMTFTALQHISHRETARIIAEIRRIAARYVLLVEDTDAAHAYVDKSNPMHFTYGRSVAEYERLIGAEFILRGTWPRQMERGFSYQKRPRPSVGHFMLFERPS